MYRVRVVARHLSPGAQPEGAEADLLLDAYAAHYLEGVPAAGKVDPTSHLLS